MNKFSQLISGKINFSLCFLLILSSVMMVSCDDDDDDDNIPVAPQSSVISDQEFMVKAKQANQAEIEMGQLAQTQTTNDSVQNYGMLMVNEHSLAQNDLLVLAANKNVTLPTTLSPADQAKKNQLMTLTGPKFDSAYMHSQIQAHQMTQDLFESQISQGQDQEVRNYASKYLPHINMHLHMADSIAATLPLK